MVGVSEGFKLIAMPTSIYSWPTYDIRTELHGSCRMHGSCVESIVHIGCMVPV